MLWISRAITALLLMALVAALPGVQAWAQSPLSPQSPSPACHHHKPASPSPASTDYRCCVTGHGWAIQSALFSHEIAIAPFSPNDEIAQSKFSPVFRLDFRISESLSSSPPSVAPLRI